MKERPILFSGPMVRAVLRDVDPKTQTRRLVRDAEYQSAGYGGVISAASIAATKRCPYGAPGDRLAVKEHAWIWCERVVDGKTPTGRPKHRFQPVGQHVVYKADSVKPTHRIDDHPARGWRLKLGRYLPRWAVRCLLEVAAVRVARLQDITEEDARAEGVCRENVPAMLPSIAALAAQAREVIHGTGHTSADPTVWPVARDYRDLFMLAWTAINGERATWASNPWVWVVGFRRIRP